MVANFKGKIITALRRLSYAYNPRRNAKNRQKIGPNTFECEHCGIWVYEGTRDIDKQLEILSSKPPKDLLKGKIHLDHKEAVIPIEGFPEGDWSWDVYISRLFCDEEGFQAICSECHHIKTTLEKQLRKEYRQKKLTNTKNSDKLEE